MYNNNFIASYEIFIGISGTWSEGKYLSEPFLTIPEENCPSAITINDIPITNSLYQAQQTVTSSGHVASGSDITFKAGQFIMLDTNFTVHPGGSLSIEIEDCQ